ncbi:MAG: L,D-transpeptidase family protein [Phycisphaerales bacterium]|nr:L,D-transpeptidase family protein [Phycisphaerales bacterium]
MALPSQKARPLKIRGGVGGRRRRRRSGGFIFAVILVGGAAGATWWLWPEGEGPGTDPAAADSPTPHSGDAASTPHVELAGRGDAAHASDADPLSPSLNTPPDGVVVIDASPAPGQPSDHRASDTAEASGATASSGQTSGQTSGQASGQPSGTGAAEPPQPSALDEAAALVRANKPVEARALLSESLRRDELSPSDAEHVRATLAAINEGLVFSRELATGDPHVALYTIEPGDSLSRIVNDQNLPVNWRFLQRLNGIKSPGHIGVGQRLKTIITPFHASVSKADHRLDLWLGEGDDAVYVRSFPVGLGEFDSTPLGAFRVTRGGKLVNPSWRNPRTGQQFNADDPENPIGEYWIALEGIEPHNLEERGFGVHGTIDPDSIGKNESMGCVRLGDDDIALLFELLASGRSTVTVVEH